ncbi:hypothetical protein K492DRAFT_205388 [Lichtheimia hyalospora FSU 10163]|nr:hypothetical protein K492DRAFT_205388 [Lichtheimia hyalospora FSU 10163]
MFRFTRLTRTLPRTALVQPRRFNVTSTGTRLETSTGNATPNIITYNHPTAPLAAFNQRLAMKLRYMTNGQRLLRQVLAITKEIEAANLKFDLNTYNALLVAYARARDTQGLLKTLKQMQANGVKPALDSYNTLMEGFAARGATSHQNDIINAMKQDNVEPTVTTYAHWMQGLCNDQQLEHAVDLLETMNQAGITPNEACYVILIGACLRWQDPEMAFKLLQEAEASGVAVESNPRIYLDVMRATSWNNKYDMVAYCWDKSVTTLNMRPDEGTCLNVLGVAARAGDAKLATKVIRQLSTSGYPYKEHYFSPLMEAFVRKKDLKSAFNVLDIMRVSGVIPTSRTTLLLQERLRSGGVLAIDNAYYVLEELRKEGRKVDVTAFNAVLGLCAQAGDLERTVATYREAKHLGVAPDIDTYNNVLEACVRTRTKGMGNVVIEEMKKAGVTPDIQTYVKMIALECTQKDYEGAFTYLEEMKGYGVVPPQECYEKLAHKLAAARDPRFHMALEEMETFGYPVHHKIRGLWQS